MTTPLPLTTLTLPHLPPDLRIHIALYTAVLNAPHLHSQLTSPNPSPNPSSSTPLSYAFIDASTLLSPLHLSAAIFRAINDLQHHRLRTRTVYSEIVYCLGYTNNIGSTLRQFGIGEGTRELVVVKVVCPSLGLGEDGGGGRGVTEESVRDHLGSVVEGTREEFGEEALRRCCDLGKVRRVYKLGSGGDGKGKGKGKGKGRRRKDGNLEGEQVLSGVRDDGTAQGQKGYREIEKERREVEMQVLGLMALRGAV